MASRLLLLFFPLFVWAVQPAYIRSIGVEKGVLVVKIDGVVPTRAIKTTLLQGPGDRSGETLYRYVFDFPAIFPRLKQQLAFPGFSSVYAAQFNTDTTRIVFYSDRARTIIPAGGEGGLRFTPMGSVSEPVGGSTDTLFTPPLKPMPSLLPRKKIVLDPGHGGKDSGAIGFKSFMEKEVVLKVTRLVEELLRKKGLDVFLTRSDDTFVELKDRTHYANERMADLFISIHANASPTNMGAKGVEVYYLSPARSDRAKKVAQLENGPDFEVMDDDTVSSFLNFLNREKIVASNKLAIDIQRSLLSTLRGQYDGIVDGGVREGPFWVLVGATMPAVLVEIGYLTNPSEAERLVNPLYQELVAQGIVTGITQYVLHN